MYSAKGIEPMHRNIAIVLLSVALQVPAVSAADEGTTTIKSPHAFDALVSRLEKSIADQKMGLVAQASASKGAAGRGVKIPGNAVLMVFRNDYAVRMLEASVPAGIEAPLRIYVTENSDGTASVAWRAPSAVFKPYGSAALDAMARELDPIFERIVRNASAPR
jgi:uncharacterized protein (DUF302 family)